MCWELHFETETAVPSRLCKEITCPDLARLAAGQRELLSLGYTHVFSPVLTSELRAGVNRVLISFTQNDQDNPATFLGITSPSPVFPQIIIGGRRRGWTRIWGYQRIPTRARRYHIPVFRLAELDPRQAFAEVRRPNSGASGNNNENGGTGGILNFSSLATFLAALASSATQTALPATPALRVSALGLFAQDDYKVTPKLTLNLGLRWEYNGVPSETHTAWRIQLCDQLHRRAGGHAGIHHAYNEQYTNFGPRVGFAYDPFGKGKTVIRGGVGIYYDQPVTNIVSPLDNNPPFSYAVNNTSNISVASPFAIPLGGSNPRRSIRLCSRVEPFIPTTSMFSTKNSGRCFR